MTELPQRFFNRIRLEDSCWMWTGGLSRGGYGHFMLNGVRRPAHLWTYTLTFGPVPDGLQIDHLCRNPSCVNPTHLEAVTPRENVRRGINFKCPHGPGRRMKDRSCRLCKSEYYKANAERIAEQRVVHRKANTEQRAAYGRRYYKENKERVKARVNAAYRAKRLAQGVFKWA